MNRNAWKKHGEKAQKQHKQAEQPIPGHRTNHSSRISFAESSKYFYLKICQLRVIWGTFPVHGAQYKSANIWQVSRQTIINVCGLTFMQVCKPSVKVSRQTFVKVCLLTCTLQVCKFSDNVSLQTLTMLVCTHLHYKSVNIW